MLAPGQPVLPHEATNLGRAQLGISGIDGKSAFAPLLADGYNATYALALKVADQTKYMGPRDRVAGILQRHLALYCNPMQRMTQDQHDTLKQKRKAGQVRDGLGKESRPGCAASSSGTNAEPEGFKRTKWPRLHSLRSLTLNLWP